MNGEGNVFPLNGKNGSFLRKRGERMNVERSLVIAVFLLILTPFPLRAHGMPME